MLLLLLISSAFVLPWAGAGRIIGGKEVKRHSRPYMAFLEIQVSNQSVPKTYNCGGFLIRPDAVLSAAHCVAKEGRVRVTVTLGAHNVRVRERSQQRIHVRDWVIHPKYSPGDLKNDIVLLKLKPRARINENVKFISIPSSRERVREGTKCKVAGWGWTSVEGPSSNVMMEVEQEVQTEDICQQQFKCKYQPQSMICVADEDGEKAPFHGDSGGPLVCNRKAHGIVSYGPQRSILPAVFTRISYFEPWIRKELRKFALQELPGSPSSD